MTVRAKAHAFEQDQEDVSEIRLAKRTTTSDVAPSWYRVARDLVGQGQHYRALRILEAAVCQGHETPETLRLLARAAAHLGEDALAQRALERALEFEPENLVTNLHYVRMLLRTGEAAGSDKRVGGDIGIGLQTVKAMAAQQASVSQLSPTAAGLDVVCGACRTWQTSGKFCSECGDVLTAPKRFCHACGGDLVAAAKFCSECGTSAATASSGASRPHAARRA